MSNRNAAGRVVAEAAAQRWVHVAVCAPGGFDHPNLAAAVGRAIAEQTARVRLTHKVAVCGCFAEPVLVAAQALAKAHAWTVSGEGRPLPAWKAVVRVAVSQATAADLVLVFHGEGGLPKELELVVDVCRRLGVPGVRVVVR